MENSRVSMLSLIPAASEQANYDAVALVKTVIVGCWALDVRRIWLLLKGFLVHNVWHFRQVAAVVLFQHVDQTLDSAPSHAFVRIDGKPCDLRATGEMMEQPCAVGDFGIEERRIRRQRLFFKDVERR